jgi:hypothetical protein
MRRRAAIWCVSILCLLAFPVHGLAVEFSTDFTEELRGRLSSGKIYVKASDVFRKDYIHGGYIPGAKRTIWITNGPKGKTWFVDPDRKTYYESGFLGAVERMLDQSKRGSKAEKATGTRGANRKLVGQELVSGYLCDKFATVFGDKRLGTRYEWIAKELKFAIKSEWVSDLGGRERFECRNIKIQKLPNALFEVPKGYRQVPPPGSITGRASEHR